MQLKTGLVLVTWVLGISAFSGTAFADSRSASDCTSCKGYSYQASLAPTQGTSGKYALTYEIKDAATTISSSGGSLVISVGEQTSAGLFQDKTKKHKPVSMPEPSAIVMYLSTAAVLFGAARWRASRTRSLPSDQTGPLSV